MNWLFLFHRKNSKKSVRAHFRRNAGRYVFITENTFFVKTNILKKSNCHIFRQLFFINNVDLRSLLVIFKLCFYNIESESTFLPSLFLL